jgi:uridylate kinase
VSASFTCALRSAICDPVKATFGSPFFCYNPQPMSAPKFKRILLKLSGEALMGGRRTGIDADVLAAIADELREVSKLGVEIAIVIGGGNIFRGVTAATEGIDRVAGDHMGMLATVINAIALQDALERRGVATRVTSAITMAEVAEPFIRRRAIRHLEKGRIVICAAGTGNPFFTTDSAAALRAAELKCDIIFKATKVDGIYTADPEKDPNAVRLPHVTYQRVLSERLQVMDAAAIDLARGSSIPIYIFSLREPGNIKRALLGEEVGSIVSDDEPVGNQ